MEIDYENIRLPLHVEEVDNLSVANKMIVYLDYFITLNSLRIYSEIIWDYYVVKYPNPIFEKKQIIGVKEYKYLWKDTIILNIEDFISKESNLIIRDFGEDWKARKFAQRYSVLTTGIYDWYWKFKDRIKFI